MREIILSLGTGVAMIWSPHLAVGQECSTYKFDQAHTQLTLRSPYAVWKIENSGPAEVVLYVVEDELVINSFGQGDGMTFMGDNNYTYLIVMRPGGKSANVTVCPPSR